MKRVLSMVLAAVLLCAALSGCGTQKSGREAANEIAVGIGQDLSSSLSPYQLSTAGTREVMFNVFEGLYKADPTGDLKPALATGYTVSSDGKTYTFTLREGVKFHNGSVMTAEDVVFSFETCAEQTVDTNLKKALAQVTSVKADGNKVTVELANADSDFLSFVANVYIAPKDYSGQDTSPVGTGPFRYVSRKVQENVVLEAFADYWGEKAKLKKVTFMIYETGTALVMALDGGTIDIAAHLTSAQIKNLKTDYTVLEGTMNLVQGLYLNNAVKPLDDVRVRQAIAYAVDVDQMLKLTADGHGTKVGSAMYPAFGKYFVKELSDMYAVNADKAKSLLKEAGYEKGFSLTIKVPSNYTNHVDTAVVLAQQLKAVGINVEVQQIEWNEWVSKVYQGRDYEATVVGFDASTLTAGAMLNRYVSDSSKNMCNFSSERYDALIAEASSITDDARRTECYREAERVLAEECASVFLQDMADFVAIRTTLSGYEFYPMYVMDLSRVGYGK